MGNGLLRVFVTVGKATGFVGVNDAAVDVGRGNQGKGTDGPEEHEPDQCDGEKEKGPARTFPEEACYG